MVREIIDIWGYGGYYDDKTISERAVRDKIIITSSAYQRNISDIDIHCNLIYMPNCPFHTLYIDIENQFCGYV